MSSDLSPQSLAYLHQMVAGGEFPTIDAAFTAAVDALRRESQRLPMVPDEHMEAVEEALADLEAGEEEEFTRQDWDELRQIVRDSEANQSK